MTNDYFVSEEFQKTLSRYEKSRQDGVSCYLDSDDVFSLAEYYVYDNKPELSADVLELGLRFHDDIVHLWVFYASVMIIMHKYSEAAEIISDINVDDDYDVLYINAQLKIAVENSPKEADNLFREWMSMTTNDESNFNTEFDDDEFDDSSSEDSKNNENDFDDIIRDMYVQIITSYVDLSQTVEVRDEYAIKWISEYVEKFSPMGHFKSDYDLANICNDMHYVDYIEIVYKMILDVDPYYSGGWGLLGAVQFFNGKIDEAIDSLQFALAVEPNTPSAMLTMAHCLCSKNNYTAALEYFQKYNELEPKDADYLNLAFCYYRLGNIDQAIENLDKITVDTTRPPADEEEFYHLYNIAETYYFCNQPFKSIYILEYLLNISPDNVDVLMFYGTCKLAIGDIKVASVSFSKMLSIADDYWQNLLSVATAFASYGPFDVAIEILDSVLNYISLHRQEESRLENVYAIMALAQFNSMNHNDYLKYLTIACNSTPSLVQQLFYQYLPETVNPIDYYDYMENMTPNK